MRITGITYRLVDHLNEGSNVRSYIFDPMRREDAERYSTEYHPSPDVIVKMYDVLDRNPYWTHVIKWAMSLDATPARLELRWPG